MSEQQLVLGFTEPAPPLGEQVSRDLVGFLIHHPTMDEIAQHLTLRTLADLQPWQCVLYECDRRGRLHLLGAFGTGECRDSLTGRSVFDDPLIGPSLRRSRPFATFGLIDGIDPAALPAMLAHGPEVVWPVTTPSRLVGVVQVSFTAIPHRRRTAECLTAVAEALGLYWVLQGGRTAPAELEDAGQPVSPRQARILEYMSRGLTNPQIATLINYSVSTVRQETMAIYKALGVENRLQAVEVAQRRGIVR